MSLVIENGTAQADATSYATVAELKAYAAARGQTVPSKDADCEKLLIKAMDFLYGLNYVGDKRTKEQALDWPRNNACVESWPLTNTEIPRQLVQVQCLLAIEYATQDLLPTTEANAPGAVVQETVVGAISVAYANTGRVNKVPIVAKADTLLRTLLKYSGLASVPVTRV